MDLNLAGRKVLITGAGDGIGRTLALDFAEMGARVAGCARSKERLTSLSKEISSTGHCFHAVDLTRPEDIQRFHDQVMEAFGGLDVLINNAGSILKLGGFFDVSDDDWQDSFNINLMSAVRLCRLFIPTLKHSGAPRIINISSIAGSRPGEIFPHYSAIKAALSNFTVSLAQTLAPEKILVNSVSPGPVWTRSWEQEAAQASKNSGKSLHDISEDIKTQTAQGVLLKRMGMPEDVSGIVQFLASDRSNWITGSNFVIDGGVNLNPY
ncbi:MAG: short-chain dehydrogenase [Nitrospinaceae bacterium]|nr:MAG: short-chain dehydrogenase [Nitrospinaceae bacterium]